MYSTGAPAMLVWPSYYTVLFYVATVDSGLINKGFHFYIRA